MFRNKYLDRNEICFGINRNNCKTVMTLPIHHNLDKTVAPTIAHETSTTKSVDIMFPFCSSFTAFSGLSPRIKVPLRLNFVSLPVFFSSSLLLPHNEWAWAQTWIASHTEKHAFEVAYQMTVVNLNDIDLVVFHSLVTIFRIINPEWPKQATVLPALPLLWNHLSAVHRRASI